MSHDTSNKCGTCTACCLVLAVHEIKKPTGVCCPHCDQDRGCRIYAQRPQGCRGFRCDWRMTADQDASPFAPVAFASWLRVFGDVSMRPDRLGVVLDCCSGDAPFKQWLQIWEARVGAISDARV
ncbi:MAG: hypothetical protein WC516_03745 [Patescibacteria group bacterium]